MAHWEGADLSFLSRQPDTSLHYKTVDKGLMHCAVCLFTPQLSLVLYLLHLPTEKWPGRVDQVELTMNMITAGR